jgi:hypothetical protein
MRKFTRLILLPVLGLVATIRTASPLTMTVVLGHSMEPTLRSGALSVLDRSYYRSHPMALSRQTAARSALCRSVPFWAASNADGP